jgi:ABC-2 type transport system ATP-binding protein
MITVEKLAKTYQGYPALDGLSLHVAAGEIYGFIGHNGAGKTTTMNILTGLSRPTSGTCMVNGRDVGTLQHPGDLNLGYLPEEPKFYPWMTANEALTYLSRQPDKGRVAEILNWIGLSGSAKRRIGSFSRGMRQRLGIGATLVNQPSLVILDEPSSALDPEGRSEVLRLIRDLKDMGKTVMLSTHILDDVERICDTVGMISKGRMVFQEPLSQLLVETGQTSYDVIPCEPIPAEVWQQLGQDKCIAKVSGDPNRFAVTLAEGMDSTALMRVFADHRIPVHALMLRKASLEDLFLRKGNGHDIGDS